MDIDESAPQDPSQSPIPKKHKQNEVALTNDLPNASNIDGLMGSVTPSKSSMSDSINSNDMSVHSEKLGDDHDDDDGDASDYDDENDYYMYDDDDDEVDTVDKYDRLFDNVDLPPGVEVSVSFLNGPAPSAKSPASTSSSTSSLKAQSGAADTGPVASSSADPVGSSGDGKDHKSGTEIMRKFQLFKQLDMVEDFSDHHFLDTNFGLGDQKDWLKKIQEEWKILEDLPDTIFVRVCETRMDLLRAAILGPAGTPYHDGLFFFDIVFPSSYPSVPPMVYYYSGGLRLNPNLYECGKVCLSLLNTWTGHKTEMWTPGKSTMLQVLVSIQALILNAKPFFNEPGHDIYRGKEGHRMSSGYNENTFILSLKTMMYTVRRPPKHFEDFVAGHFYARAHDILEACKGYINGAVIGSLGNQVDSAAKDSAGKSSEGMGGGSKQFKASVSRMLNPLITTFTKNGSSNCEQFGIAAEQA